jgi:hypothetical protein
MTTHDAWAADHAGSEDWLSTGPPSRVAPTWEGFRHVGVSAAVSAGLRQASRHLRPRPDPSLRDAEPARCRQVAPGLTERQIVGKLYLCSRPSYSDARPA